MTDQNRKHERAGSSERGALGTVTRRDYLRAVGGGSAIGALTTAGVGTVGAQSDDWEAEANERIAEHRLGSLEVQVVDESGQPVSGADVDVEMREHEFGWGTALSASTITGDDDDISAEDRQQLLEYVPELFNTGVFGNIHKWRFFENDQDVADEATAWAVEQGLRMRGHVCLWGNVDAWAVPGDVVDAMGVEHESGDGNPQLDPEYVYERSMEHLETIISHYADFEYDGVHYGSVIDQWDVVNEVVHVTEMIEVIDGEDVEAVEAPVLAEWYERADEVAPDDVSTDVNDYNTLAGPYEYAREPYERQIEFLRAEGTGLDGAGMQCHFNEDEQLAPEEIWEGLERYAQHGVDLRITEFDLDGDEWAWEDRAAFFYEFLKTIFSHPSVTDFVMWGFWNNDNPNWDPEPPLFHEDWTPTPCYDVYVDLVFDEWWTDGSGTTGTDGTFEVDAFLGEHEITASVEGETTTETVSVTDADGVTEIVVELSTDGGGEECAADEIEIAGEYCAADTTGDGLYNDLNGDGATTTNDVVTFFENVENPTVTTNVEYFDFDGNGQVSINDVIELFGEM